jgi:hypothetical protein
VQRCADPTCDFFSRFEGEPGRAIAASQLELDIIPPEIRERYANQRIYVCGYCEAIFADPYRLIGKIGWADGRRKFWPRGETKLP